tara:strand:- start:31 stop:462 length:432 start_codon:yes stop_codon:yes gene_type:complete
MEEEFYAIIKLVSGEELFSLVMVEDANDEDPLLILQNPLIMYMHNSGRSQFIKVKPWMDLSDEDIYMIRLSKIITMTESKNDRLVAIYENFVSEEIRQETPIAQFQATGRIKPDSRMGFISSVKDARKKLEADFKLKPDPKES